MSEVGMLPSEVFARRGRTRMHEKNKALTPFGPYALAIPEPDIGPLDLRKFPFQREILMETGDLPEVIASKGTQVTMTTTFVRWSLWVGEELRGRVLYVMPTQDIADAFSDDRVKRLMDQPELAERIPAGGTQNKRLKRIGTAGLIYFRGSMEETALDNIPARALVLDEYDTLNQANIPVVEARVGAQDDPLIRRLGVPRLQGIGIDRLYRQTDMRRWLVQCPACNAWQRIQWENLRWEELGPGHFDAWRVCVECEQHLEDTLFDGGGEWVAEYPDRERRGYHIPRLIAPHADMGKIVAGHFAESETAQQNHYNRDLAEPFETPDQRLSLDAIESCKRGGLDLVESYVGFNAVTMSIDQSTTRGLHVRISEHLSPTAKRTLWLGIVPVTPPTPVPEGEDGVADESALRRLAGLMEHYQVKMAAIDHLPDGIFARAFCAAHPGRAYMVAFNTKPLAEHSITIPKPNQAVNVLVTVKRSEWIGITLNLFRWQRVLLPMKGLPPDYGEQLRNAIKTVKTDSADREFYVYETSGPVDWLMAELYDVVATEVLKRRLMEGALDAATRPQEVAAPNPTPDFNDWDAKPWEKGRDKGDRGTYSSGWDDTYRP